MSRHDRQDLMPGSVIEFFDAKEITVGVCLAVKGQRLTVLSMTNREINLAGSRVLHVGESLLDVSKLTRDEMVQRLQSIDRLRKDLMGRTDVEELWSLLEGQEEAFSAQDCAEFIFSDNITGDHVAAAQRSLLQDRLFFQHRDGTFFPRASEKVQQRKDEIQKEEERVARLEESANWLQSLWTRRTKVLGVQEAHGELITDLQQFCMHGQEAPSYSHLKEVFKKANIPPLQQSAFRILVRLGVWDEDENLLLHALDISKHFPEELERKAKELNSLPLSLPEHSHRRRDLRDLHAITIDSAQTRDIDDALSARRLSSGHYEIGVHIADAAEYVVKGDDLDEEAQARTTSIYLPDAKIPMLPSSLSEGICSLHSGVDRLAISFLMQVDEGGNILGHEICQSVIHIKERLTYEQVNGKVFEDATLGLLHRFALVQREQRTARGAINLPLPEIQVRVLPSGMIQLSRHEKETPSQLMVSEWMIVANGLAAAHLAKLGIPSLYRGQGECRPERDFVQSDHEIFHIYRQRRLFARAELDTQPHAHCSLGMEPYTTVSSPIRRYADLVVQRQLKSALKEEAWPYTEEELRQIIMQLGTVQSKVFTMQRKWTRYWMLKYMEQEDIQSFNALVLDQNGRFAHLLLVDYLMETNLPVQEGMELQRGSLIKVQVERLNPREDILRVQLA